MVFEFDRDEDEIKVLMMEEEEFWFGYVKTDTPPPADGSASTSDTLTTLYPESNGDSVNLMAYDTDLKQYIALSAQIKELEKLKDEYANKVKAFLGESAGGLSNHYKVSWTSSQRVSFDSKKFASDHADMDLSNYYKTSNYRTFKVTEYSK